MYWRLTRSQWERGRGAGNRRAFRKIVQSGAAPGLLAYAGDEPVGWCAVQPRTAFPALERSRILRPVDDQPVWSVVCLFIARAHRRHGVSRRLLRAAAKHARERGARILEGYPVEPRKGGLADAFAWTGIASAYRAAGFTEVARRSPTRPIMRRVL
jgi:GNAT superfamily N-acetyltransferase